MSIAKQWQRECFSSGQRSDEALALRSSLVMVLKVVSWRRMMGEFSNIEDRLEIAALNQRYALHVDFREIEEWVSLFTPAAVFDESEFDNPLMNGHDEIRAYGYHLTEIVRHVLHHMTTHHIFDMTATTARGRAFGLIEAVLNDGTHARTHVVYEDRYEKIAGTWLIAERILRKTIEPEAVAAGS